MIKFINKQGEVFDGLAPYVHWIEGQQSIGLWYELSLMVISDSSSIEVSVPEDSKFKLVKTDLSTYNDDCNITDLIYESNSHTFSSTVQQSGFYIYQISFLVCIDAFGQYTENIKIGGEDVIIGGDFYGVDEILSINLSNRGLDLPITIQKSFLASNVNEENIDYILINRKFKELISNFLDVVDCKGSYKSLYNSLSWFEWGNNAKLYELWEDPDTKSYLMKDLTLYLEENFKHLIYTHRKTTHLALTTALQTLTGEIDQSDGEKNPEVVGVEYDWSVKDIMIKTSLLAAFFERYFMPIHLDLKSATAQSIVFTNAIKVKNGSYYYHFNYHDDTGVMDIQMNNVFVLGNLGGYAVDRNTTFGVTDIPNSTAQYYEPIGVKPLNDLEASSGTEAEDSETYKISFSQLVGGVGAIIPVHVEVPVEEGDGISVMTLTTYNENGVDKQITDRKLRWSENVGTLTEPRWAVKFDFNLVSTHEEKKSFTLVLHSLSGHTWTGAATYQTVDISGSKLKVCKVEGSDEWNNSEVGFNSQYNTGLQILQYIPYSDENGIFSHLNESILIENPDNGEIDPEYDNNWTSVLEDDTFYAFYHGPLGTNNKYQYVTLIYKNSGYWEHLESLSEIEEELKSIYSEARGEELNISVKSVRFSFIPQIHTYREIGLTYHDLSDFTFSSGDLLCVIPQFKQSLLVEPDNIRWIFENKTTGEKIEYNTPFSTPLIADSVNKPLTKGYWSVTMKFRLGSEDFVLTKNSAFKIA